MLFRSVAAYSSLLTDTFSGNHDLDARAAALHQDGVDAAAVMVRRLNAIADEEGLSFRIGGVSASDVTDITCYLGRDGLWLASVDASSGLRLTLGEGTRCGGIAAARYVLEVASSGGGLTVTAWQASTDADGARDLAATAQKLLDSMTPTA